MESESLDPPAPAAPAADDGDGPDGTAGPTPPAAPAPEAVEPEAARPSSRSTWTFRIVGGLALLLAVWFCFYAFARSPDQADTSPVDDPAIVQQVPTPGSHVLRQSQVGVLLQSGYDGRLTINGTAIPEGQMDGAVDPRSANFDPRYGVRPNNKSSVFFTPGPGKVITRYNTGEVNIVVQFWEIARGRSHARKVSWAVFVT